MDKVGILFICTGKYSIFWDGFYKATEELFLKDKEKHYFIWTDDSRILNLSEEKENIHTFRQVPEKWPYPTLKRFEYFLDAEDRLKDMDYLFFMNGTLKVNKEICGKEVLPENEECLTVTLHPGFFSADPREFTYEENPESEAYIEKGKGKYYFAGGFNGGKTKDYLRLIHTLSDNINKDLEKKIIAKWHDESHLNKYMAYCDSPFRILSPAYLYPEGWDLPLEDKITVLDKGNIGGHDYLRDMQNA